MGSYYYFIAQLPYLVYDQKPPMSSGAFKSLAQTLMDEKDSAFLGHLSLDPDPGQGGTPSYAEAAPPTGCGFVDFWRDWERALRLNLAKHRAAHLRREASNAIEPPPVPAEAASVAARAVASEGTPLDGEMLIDKARWNAIDALAGIDNFSANQAYAYYLKLLLLERRQAFNTDNGFSEYKSLYADIIESAHKSLGDPA